MAVVGEPGVGKSRLFFEFAHSHRTQDWLILESGSVSYGKATPYLPVIDLLKAYFQIDSRDDARKVREKISGKLVTLDETLLPTLSACLALLDVAVEDAQWQALDPAQRRDRTLETVKRLILREGEVQPLVLVLEDLHWIDSETQAVLDNLVESLPTARVLLLGNYRPEYRHAWSAKSYYRQIQLHPLPSESAEEVLDALLGNDPDLAPLKRLLIQRTEGNPFFLEESIRTLIETKALTGERGAHRLARPVESIQVPATVHAVLAARIDRLPSEDKQLLQTAAVIGHELPLSLLQAIAGLPDARLRRSLGQLQAAEFMYETKLFPDQEYTFKHALTHDVAYGGLLQERRRTLHAQIVEAMEHLYAGRLTEHVERLAHHAVPGAVWDKALSYLHQSGAKAMDRSAYQEAAAYFEKALVALEHQPATRETSEYVVDVRFQLRTALVTLGEFGRVLGMLREADTFAEQLGDSRRRAQVSVYMSISYYLAGELGEALATAQRALVLGEALEDDGLQGVANQYIGFAHAASTDYRRAVESFGRATAFLTGPLFMQRVGLAAVPSSQSRAFSAYCLAELGLFAEAIALGEEAIRIADAVGHTGTLTLACWGAGQAYLRKGDFADSVARLERGLEAVRALRTPLYLRYLAPALGCAYALSGRTAEAVSLIEEAVENDIARSYLAHHALTLVYLAEAYLMAGRLSDSKATAERALELARNRHERGHEAHALRLLAEIASHGESRDIEQAERHYREARAVGSELGMRPLVAHCYLGLGKLDRRTDKQQQAQEHFGTAITMYRDMGMDFWLEQAEAEQKASAS